jgi:hypothetical protein
MYLLDTNVVSEMRRPERADPRVIAWLNSVAPNQLFLSAVTVLELEMGVLQVAWRDATQGEMLRSWLEGQVLPSFAERILPMDLAVARRCARLHVPNPRPERDCMIAATAEVHRLTVVTRNLRVFQGVPTINPWVEH